MLRVFSLVLWCSFFFSILSLTGGCTSGKQAGPSGLTKAVYPKGLEEIKGGAVRMEDARILAGQNPDNKVNPIQEYNSGPYGPQPPE